jgi:hypothetical protein
MTQIVYAYAYSIGIGIIQSTILIQLPIPTLHLHRILYPVRQKCININILELEVIFEISSLIKRDESSPCYVYVCIKGKG